jgi:hydroxymethylglutaryl-CoA lyase
VADTIGVGSPLKVQTAMERALKHFPLHEVSGHFHDIYGQALANVDASVAGLGIETGVDIDKLVDALLAKRSG